MAPLKDLIKIKFLPQYHASCWPCFSSFLAENTWNVVLRCLCIVLTCFYSGIMYFLLGRMTKKEKWENAKNFLLSCVVIKYLFQIIILLLLTMMWVNEIGRYWLELVRSRSSDKDVGWSDWGSVWGQWVDQGEQQETLYSYLAGQSQSLSVKWSLRN